MYSTIDPSDLDFLISHTAIDIVCMVLLLISLKRFKLGSVKVPNSQYIITAIGCAFIMIIDNVVWYWFDIGGVFAGKFMAYFINITYFMAYQCFFFYMYIYFSLTIIGKPLNPKEFIIKMTPCLIMCILNVLDFVHKLFFYVTDTSNYERGILYPLEYVFAYSYLLVPYFYSLKQIFRYHKEGMPYKKVHLNVLTMPATIGIMGLINIWYKRVPLLSIAIAFTIVFLYIDTIEDFVTLDPITTLPTRPEFMKEVKNRIDVECNKKRNDLYLIVMDIVHLSMINDRFGYNEGDNLIRRIAVILQRPNIIGEKIRAFAARIKGDKFYIVVNTDDPEIILDFCKSLRFKINKSDTINMTDYHTDVTFGTSKYIVGETLANFLEDAENDLNHNKNTMDKLLKVQSDYVADRNKENQS